MGLLSIRVLVPRFKLVAGVSVAALLVACTGFVGGAGAGITGMASFNDPPGDAQGGPDVTSVTIDGDAATGVISLSVKLSGYPLTASVDGLERYVELWLDTDKNGAIGDPEDGTEFGLQSWVDSTGRWWSAGRWNGSAFEAIPQSTTSFVRAADVVTWTVNATELGATRFSFYVLAGTWNDAEEKSVTRDEAPSAGWWEYDISASTATPPKPPAASVGLIIGAPTTNPKAPTGGKRFTVSFDVKLQKTQPTVVIDLQTGETRESLVVTWRPLSRGKAVASPSVGGKAIRSTASLRDGEVRVSMVIPKAAKGKLLRVPVKVTGIDSGKTVRASRVATFRIK